MKLKASHQSKKRYLLLEHCKQEDVKEAILSGIGVLGWAKANPVFLSRDNKLILAVERTELDRIKACLALSSASLIIKKISGTLAALER